MIVIKIRTGEKKLEQKIADLLAREQIEAEVFSSSSPVMFSFHGLTIDGAHQQVLCHGSERRLTKIEYNLLLFLAMQANQVISKEEIFKAVWGNGSEDTLKVVANTISNLRKKVEPCGSAPRYIKTVPGGYQFSAEANQGGQFGDQPNTL
jgi:DNA-binding response OmpR family regulator